MPGFENAVKLAKENKTLGVGIHLNIVRGKPVSKPEEVSSLLNKNGNFLTIYPFVRKFILGKIEVEQIEKEFRAQIEKVFDEGIEITHFDSEKHVHSIPKIMRVVIKFAKEYKIPKIRFINEFCISFDVIRSLKTMVVSCLNRKMKRSILKAGILIPDRFYGICGSGRMNSKNLIKILTSIPEGVTEIMMHPGIIDEDYRKIEQEYGPYYLKEERERELEALIDLKVREIIEGENIQLINYRDLN